MNDVSVRPSTIDRSAVAAFFIIVTVTTLAVRLLIPALPPTVGPIHVILGGVGLTGFLIISVSRPLVSLSFILLPLVSGWNPTVAGSLVEIRLSDVFFLSLAVSVLIQSHTAVRLIRLRFPLALFIGLAGSTIIHIALADPDFVSASFVSWLRLLQAGLLLPLAVRAVEGEADVRRLFQVIAAGAAFGIIYTAAVTTPAEWISTRPQVLQNVNAMALTAGMLLIIAVLSNALPRPVSVIGVVVAVLGLVIAKSLGASLGIAITLTVAALKGRVDSKRVARAVVVGILMMVAFVLILTRLRPIDDPRNAEFWRSSTAGRVVLATAGWELFKRNPIFGVGWQRSSDPDVIGDPDVTDVLKRQFPFADAVHFPDIQNRALGEFAQALTVHNMYVQIAAEMGIIGLAALIFLFISIRRSTRLAWRHPLGRAATLSMLLVAIWWNDNPLYGGQVETVAFIVLLGASLSIAREMDPDSPAAVMGSGTKSIAGAQQTVSD